MKEGKEEGGNKEEEQERGKMGEGRRQKKRE